MVGDRRRLGGRRGLRGPPALPAQRPLVLARRPAVRLRAGVRQRPRTSSWARSSARRSPTPRRLPPIKRSSTSRSWRSRSASRSSSCARSPVAGDALEPRDVGRCVRRRRWSTGALTIACIAGAIAIAEGGMSLADAAPDVRHGRGRHRGELEHRDRGGHGRRHRPPRGRGAARAGRDRLRRLPRLHLRAPAPREARVPLRGQPRAHALARGGRGDRGRARPVAGGVPLRDRRGRALQRRRHAAAHDLRARRRAGDDGRGGPRGGGGAGRADRPRAPGRLAHARRRARRLRA